jgi:hypothetical protein
MGLVFPYLRTSEMFELLADPVLIMADYNRAQVLRLGKLNKLCSVHYYADLDAEILTVLVLVPVLHPGSRIQKQQQKRGVNLLSYFYFSHKFHKIESYFIFEMLKKKIFKELLKFLPKKLSPSSPGIRKKPIPDPGSRSRGQKGTGSRLRNTACYHVEG